MFSSNVTILELFGYTFDLGLPLSDGPSMRLLEWWEQIMDPDSPTSPFSDQLSKAWLNMVNRGWGLVDLSAPSMTQGLMLNLF